MKAICILQVHAAALVLPADTFTGLDELCAADTEIFDFAKSLRAGSGIASPGTSELVPTMPGPTLGTGAHGLHG